MHKLPLSVFIITKNEEKQIEQTINAVKNFVNEVLVIDSGSTDNTINIATKCGAKVHHHEWEGYEKQKAYAEKLCLNDWILNIDADEEVSGELQTEILSLFSHNMDVNTAYRINIAITLVNEAKSRLFAPSNNPIRLYNKTTAGFSNKKTFGHSHDSVIVNSHVKIKSLTGKIYHRSFQAIKKTMEKFNIVTDAQANDYYKKNGCPSNLRIIIELPLAFFKTYIIRRYFILGIQGFINAFMISVMRFVRLIKAKELDS